MYIQLLFYMLCFDGPCLWKQTFHVQLSCADHCFDFRKNTRKTWFFSFGLCKPVSISPKNQWLSSRRSQSYLPVSEKPIITVSIPPPTPPKKIKNKKNKGLPCSERCIPPGGNKASPRFPKCLLDIPRPLSCRPLLTPPPLPPTVSHYQEARVTRKSKLSLLGCGKIISSKWSRWAEPVLTGSASRRFSPFSLVPRLSPAAQIQDSKKLEWRCLFTNCYLWQCVHLLSTAWQYFC